MSLEKSTMNRLLSFKGFSSILFGVLLLVTQPTYAQDRDQDGIVDANDLDDDNDGILDTDECGALIDVFISLENFETASFVSDASVNDPNCTIVGCILSPRGGGVLIGDTTTINCWSPTTGVVEGTKGAHPVPSGNALVFNSFSPSTGPNDPNSCNGLGDQNGNGRAGEITAISNIPITEGSTYSVAIYAAELTNTNPFTDSYSFRFYDAGTATLAGIPDFELNNITQNNQNWQLNESNFTATATKNIDIVLVQTIERILGGDIALDAFSIIERVCSLDTDNDGVLNVFDLDSDNDGCPDALEGNGNFEFGNLGFNQSLNGTVDANGVPTVSNGGQQSDTEQNANIQSFACCLSDFDNDGVCDNIDLDDDNDGILDAEECQLPELLNYDINSFALLPPFMEVNNCTEGIWFSPNPVYSIGQPNDICFDPGSTPGTITDYTTGSETTGTILGIQAGPGNDFLTVLSFNQNLQANTNYQLSLAYMIWTRADNPTVDFRGAIQILINGVIVENYEGSAGLPFGVWEFGSLNFNTGAVTNTNIEIQIKRGSNTSGNDYMLDDVILRQLDTMCNIDTDGDGITNDKDLDSDNDGCADALEGTLFFDFSSLNPDGSLNSAVDVNGVPLTTNGGQNSGSSADSSILATVCEDPCTLNLANETLLGCDSNGTPSDQTDDSFGISLNPEGLELGANYSVSVDGGLTISPATAAYGAATNFTLIGLTDVATDYTLTITDENDGACTLLVTFQARTCSDECTITIANETLLGCDSNGTPSDQTDDSFGISLNPEGLQLGTNYAVSVDGGLNISPATATYGTTTNFVLTGLSDSNTTYTITITDENNTTCSLPVSFQARTCSDQCTLNNANETILGCDGNGTPSDPSDDSFVISLNPQGTRLGANYTVSVDGGLNVTPTTASYGTATNFTFTGLTDTDTTYTLTITDENDAACALPVTFQARTCSDQCTLNNANETILGCDGNGTPSDSSDDSFAISLDPQGTRLGANYTVSVDGGLNVTPTTASYGTATNFTFTGITDTDTTYTLTITDENDAACALPVSFQARTCSDQCTINNANETILGCDNNGTLSDPSDDSFAISLNPEGLRLGTNYSVSVDGGLNISPAIATYGTTTNFTLTGLTDVNTNYTLTITDENNSTCTLPVSFLARTCSDLCSLSNSNETILGCNDNGTPSDPSDDSFGISLNPEGLSLGSNYTVSVSGGIGITPSTAIYGAGTSFTLTGLTDIDTSYTVLITDESDNACTLEVNFQARTCSDACNLTNANETTQGCNDNGTPSDPLDDSFSISLDPEGQRLGATYTVSVNGGLTISPLSANYGVRTNFTLTGLTDVETAYTITLTDENDNACILPVTFQARTCSDLCNITDANETIQGCDDNGTPSDPLDDSFGISLDPQGLRLGGNYSVTVNEGLTINPTTATYGAVTNFTVRGLTDTNTSYTLTITDENDNACTLPVTFQVRTCSDVCAINDSNLVVIGCNDNETPYVTQAGDDFIEFTLFANGNKTGELYSVSYIGDGSVEPSIGEFGSVVQFRLNPGTADGNTNHNILISSITGENCELVIPIAAVESCSTIPFPIVTNDLIDPNRIDLEILNVEGIENFPENKVTIYNRWGNTVYQITNYDNRDNSFKGKSNANFIFGEDENLPKGVYYYVIEFKIGTDDYQKISGYLYKK